MTQAISYCDLPLFQKSLPHRKDFAEYDAANPQIWQAFERMALSLIAKGVKHWGAKAIFEVLRYQTAIEGNDGFWKINNNFHAGYARKFVAKYPEHKGFFELREHHE